jgi:drug/metabolite transporter (DMT)-like permease
VATTASGKLRVAGRPGITRGGAFLVLLLANTLWAGTYTAGKVALRDLSPVELNAVRFSLATLLLAPVLIRGWRLIPKDRATLLALARLALLGFVLNKAFEYFGLALSTASDVALLIATESLFTALLSWTLLRERVTRTGVLALVVGLLGAYLIVERGFVPNFGCAPGVPCAGGGRALGDLLVVFSLLIESSYTVLGKTTLDRVPPILFTSVTIAGSLFVWLPAGAVAVAQHGWPHVSPAGWLGVLYMAAIATVMGYWLWFRALSVLDASAAAPTLFIQPLLGATLAIWLLHDALTWATLLGGALIFVSLLLVMRSGRRPAPVHAPVGEEPIP